MIELPDPSSPYFEIVKLSLTLCAGGVLTLAGAVIPKLVEYWLGARREGRTARQRRLEDAIRRLYQFDEWLNGYVRQTAFNDSPSTVQNSEPDLVIIAKMYFQELEREWAALDARAASYRAWATQSAQKRIKAMPRAGSEPCPFPDLTEGFAEVYEAYRESFVAFERKVVELARNGRAV